jgi:hypothetical protein
VRLTMKMPKLLGGTQRFIAGNGEFSAAIGAG